MNKPTQTAPLSDEVKGSGAPTISLPKGGGAVRGIGEKFAANPVTGTGSLSVPLSVSPGRSGFGPALSLSYDSGSGNGIFGLGWSLSLPSITRKTDKGLPQYRDAEESDVFILSGSEDLTPVLAHSAGKWQRVPVTRTIGAAIYSVQSYRPRIEASFARIERWTNVKTGVIHWRSITKDNITTVYGKNDNSRIYDPYALDSGHPSRIFSWLISESYDDKGNAIVYEYKSENAEGVDLAQASERNRTDSGRSANRYLKRIKYGNRVSRLIEPELSETEWMFKLVFDYGEHDEEAPTPDDAGAWLCRHDPISVYRAGFEVRTYRLCQRVLLFHHFPDEDGVGPDCLVRSTDFVYQSTRNNPDDLKRGHPVASFISSITYNGYKRTANGYLKRSMPSLEFKYSQPLIQEEVREIDSESLENLPYGLGGSLYQWVDLDGEGLSGILTEQAHGWFYKRNLSPLSIQHDDEKQQAVACFAPIEVVAAQPSLANLSAGRQQFLDLAGDGQLDLVQFDAPCSGFYERGPDDDWSLFTPFRSLPDIDWNSPHLKFVDLTGDGHTDVIISEDEVFTWYPSLAEEGFGAPERVSKSLEEEKGPRLVFGDGTQSVYLADMSGDGMADLVRVRNGEVCYWPNLGYGRFGAKVSMDNSPLLDRPELFDQQRIRLADLDGSGVTDLLYLGSDGVHIYINQSGNSWDEGHKLTQFPHIDDLVSVTATDLLGNGTACLVWSSSLPGVARRPMRYIDLMGGQKPHLLVGIKNNMGVETSFRYAPSTKFYLEDKLAGRPWVTKLPFPMHVVERVEIIDRVSNNRFVSRYAYHHGYFDGTEREFRGFGMVEQWDTEEIGSLPDDETSTAATNLDAASFVPPIHTKTWFHTGAYMGRDRIANYFAGLRNAEDSGEYYREPDWSDEDAKLFLLDDTVLPDGLTLEEEREACRALKGAMLRQEVYGLDGTEKAQHPYTVTEQNFTIERLQPQASNRHAVFFAHARETLSYQYERNSHDPRIGHTITLETDKYGNVMKSVTIGYGRSVSPLDEETDRDKQTQTLITYTENSVTFAVDDAANPDDYRAPLPCEERTFELTGYAPSNAAPRFKVSDFVMPDDSDAEGRKQLHLFDSELAYEEAVTAGERQRRLIERVRTLYRKDDLSGLLPHGQLEPLGLPGQSYKLAFTPGLLEKVYKRKLDPNAQDENLLPDPVQVLGGKGGDEGGYVDLDADGQWWIPSGIFFYSTTADSANPAATAQSELTEAEQHFFSPRKFTDPFNQKHLVDYDEYDLMVVRTEDATQNIMMALYDYRVLQPRQMTDPNDNRSEVQFDALGMVVGTALMGKAAGPQEGDSFNTFTADLTPQQIKDYFDAANPRPLAVAHLGTATTRVIYDLDRVPACAASIARETHVSDLNQGEQTKVHLSFVYSDGVGREAQTKTQAEPGPLNLDDPAILNPRWVSTGATIYNNKGKPVRQYEPFFSATHHYGIEQHGVSGTIFYDPAARVVATLHPNHTWEKVVFDPWQQTVYDVNDTVLNFDGSTDPKSDEDVKGFFSRLPDANYLPTWYEQRITLPTNDPERQSADKAAVHRQTPTVSHLDVLGRAFLVIAHNRFKQNQNIFEEKYATRAELDIESNQREARDSVVQGGDALGRIVMRYDYDMLGNRIRQSSMEAGERWMLNDVMGNPVRAWDSREFDRRITYDKLRRAAGLFVTENDVERLAGLTVYGESEGATDNHRGRVFKIFDAAGVITNVAYDFKGNLRHLKRELLPDYKVEVDWKQNPAPTDGTFNGSTTFDALNRPTAVTTPDNSTYLPVYNEANLLDRVGVKLRGAATATPFVTNIDYDAKGRRTLIHYANGAETTYEYDDKTFRLIHLKTRRNPVQNGLASQVFKSAAIVQDLYYTYDPAGNITRIEDAALPTIFHNGQQVEPVCDYTYDAVYRLIEASGREHIGQATFDFAPPGDNFRDYHFAGPGANPNDLQALRNYTEQYEYDAAGNFQKLIHLAGSNGTWTRDYVYDEPSLIESAKKSNRLSSTTIGQTVENYAYDAHGNMTAMPHLTLIEWNFQDELRATSKQAVSGGTPETTYYVYDASGQRVRKVTERQNETRKSERIYLGGFELYREYDGSGAAVVLERETLHVMDDKQRIALVETKTVESGSLINGPISSQRYQFGNHLGSASLELDKQGGLISYEEYHPYGTTAFQAINSAAEVSLKRYRYTGRERDEESGLSYHGARYYAPWLGRWTAADPLGLARPGPADSAGESEDVTYFGRQYPDTNLQKWAGANLLELRQPGEGGINLYAYVDGQVLITIDQVGLFPTKNLVTTASSWKTAFEKKVTIKGKIYDRGGTTKGTESAETLKRYGETEGSQTSPAPTGKVIWMSGHSEKHPTAENQRYIYTRKGGWIDMAHFMFYAGRARMYREEFEAKLKDPNSEVSKRFQSLGCPDVNALARDEAMREGNLQEQQDKENKGSKYSYEDLPSDYFGADFGANYFDPNSSKTLAEQIDAYLTMLKPSEGNQAPNWADVPSGSATGLPPLPATNKTIQPMYTSYKPSYSYIERVVKTTDLIERGVRKKK